MPGFPTNVRSDDQGDNVPSGREWKRIRAAKGDQQLFDCAAAWRRDDLKRRRVAGLQWDRVGHPGDRSGCPWVGRQELPPIVSFCWSSSGGGCGRNPRSSCNDG